MKRIFIICAGIFMTLCIVVLGCNPRMEESETSETSIAESNDNTPDDFFTVPFVAAVHEASYELAANPPIYTQDDLTDVSVTKDQVSNYFVTKQPSNLEVGDVGGTHCSPNGAHTIRAYVGESNHWLFYLDDNALPFYETWRSETYYSGEYSNENYVVWIDENIVLLDRATILYDTEKDRIDEIEFPYLPSPERYLTDAHINGQSYTKIQHANCYQEVLSPDGTKIAFCFRYDHMSALCIYDIEKRAWTGVSHEAALSEEGKIYPNQKFYWSADGSMLFYEKSNADGSYRLCVFDVDGQVHYETPLTNVYLFSSGLTGAMFLYDLSSETAKLYDLSTNTLVWEIDYEQMGGTEFSVPSTTITSDSRYIYSWWAQGGVIDLQEKVLYSFGKDEAKLFIVYEPKSPEAMEDEIVIYFTP